MITRNTLMLVFLGALLCASSSFPQTSQNLEVSSFREANIIMSRFDTIAYLPHQLIVKNSELVYLDSVLLRSGRDYELDDRFGVIRFLPVLIFRLHKDTLSSHALGARYQILPFHLKERYQHRELVIREDTSTGRRVIVSRPTSTFSVDDLFGANLQKSGSIVRGFSIGSNRDLSLTSGFRMQMAGKIASDVEVVAALTDENTPIQPQGNTQTLQEIDKVFVEIRSTDVAATLGDFNVDFTGNEFAQYHRKLQGAKGTANYRTGFSNGSVIISGAITRGKFTTNQFQGSEGFQGPYRLSGQNTERNIIIIAGTERVYVDGELMARGETNDYTIDYASGEIFFTIRRLITAASRIVVDFEYTDRQFARNLIGGRTNASFLNDKLNFEATFIREADDQDAPIDVSLSGSDKEILRDAGADRLKASRSGVDSVGVGKGQYVAVDTIISGSPLGTYRYAPGDSNAFFNVFFSFVGDGLGDYAKVGAGIFRFVGVGQGGYLPIRFLPMPQLHSLFDFNVGAQLTDFFRVSGEYALSTVDANRFSSIDDIENKGPAVRLGILLAPRNVKIGGTNIGSFDLTLRERFVDRRFTPIDRTNEVEFNRKWDLDSSSAYQAKNRLGKVDEEIREGSLTYQPIKSLSMRGGLGWIKRGDQFTSNRTEFKSTLNGEQTPRVDYDLEIIKSRDQSLDNLGRWVRQRALAEYTFDIFTPGFRYEGESRRTNSLNVDSLKPGSFRYDEFAPRLTIGDFWNMSLTSELEWRTDNVFLTGSLQRESETFTQRYAWKQHEWNSLSSSIEMTLRKKRFTETFRLQGNNDIKTVLLRFQSRYAPLNRGLETDWFYDAATERTSKLERQFVRVPRGSGNYRYLGDVNDNGIVDDADFQLDRFDGEFVAVTVPSDELFSVVDLKASTRFRVTPSRFLSKQGWFTGLLSALSTETYLRVEEKSRESDTRQIYFLHLSRFLNDSTTINGINFLSQDVHVFENNPIFSLRLRYSQRNGFTQFALGNERSYLRERSVRIRWQLVKEISNQTDYVNKNDRVTASQIGGRARDIVSNTVSTDWSYRPEQNIELGFTFGVGRSVDSDSIPSVAADLNSQSVRLLYSFQERGQGRAELQREEVSIGGTKAVLPFELTGGRVPGRTWLWRVGFDFRLTQFLQASLNYDGRSEGSGNPIHNARAEVRAFF